MLAYRRESALVPGSAEDHIRINPSALGTVDRSAGAPAALNSSMSIDSGLAAQSQVNVISPLQIIQSCNHTIDTADQKATGAASVFPRRHG